MGVGASTKPGLVPLVLWGQQRLPVRWRRNSVQTSSSLSINGKRTGYYHHKFEGGKLAAAVVLPPEAYRESQGKQNKTVPICAALVSEMWLNAPV